MVECLIASYDEIIIDDDLCSVCDDQLRLILSYRIEIKKINQYVSLYIQLSSTS